MQLLIIAAVVGFAAAAFAPSYPDQTRSQEKFARILENEANVGTDSYAYRYKTENGIAAEEQGKEVEGIEAQGSFQYTGDDGVQYLITYSAGQGGFQPQGAHIPTPPPISEEILRALEQNARDEAAGIFDDGKYTPGKYEGAALKQQAYRPQPNTPFRQQYKF